MLQRRTFLKCGTAALWLAAPAEVMATVTPMWAQVQAFINPATIEAGLNCVGELCGATSEFVGQQKTADQLDAIEKKLKDVNDKLEALSHDVRRLPELLRRIEIEQECDGLISQIKVKEGTVLDRARQFVDGDFSDQAHEELKAAAISLHDNRIMLADRKFGPKVYPFIARAFASHAIAMRVLDDSVKNFETNQTATKTVLHLDSLAFKTKLEDVLRAAEDLREGSKRHKEALARAESFTTHHLASQRLSVIVADMKFPQPTTPPVSAG